MSFSESSSPSQVQQIFNILIREPDSKSQTAQNAVKELENMNRTVVETEISKTIRSTATFKTKRIPVPIPLLAIPVVAHVKLGKDEKEVWSSTAHLLSFIRDLALKPLLEASIDSDGMVSYYATMLLSLFGEKRAVPFLVQTLEKSPYANIRRNLVRALGELGDPSVVPHILKTAIDWWNLDVVSTASLFSNKKYDQAVKDLGIDKNREFECDGMKFEALTALLQLGCSPKELLPSFANYPRDRYRKIGDHLMGTFVLDKMTLLAFSDFMTASGFKSKIMESGVKNPTKGVVKLEGFNVNYVVKDVSGNVAKIIFVIEGIGKRIDSLTLKHKDDYFVLEKAKELRWDTRNKMLASELNSQLELTKLWSGIGYRNLVWSTIGIGRNDIWVDGNRVLQTKDDSAIIVHGFHRLPPKEYFDAIEQVAYHIRKVG